MLLSDNQILQHLVGGAVVISPFNEKQLNNVSYDLTLGDHFAIQANTMDIANVKNFNDSFTMQYYESTLPFNGGVEQCRWEVFKVDMGILLNPGQRILAHSREFAGGRVNPVNPDVSVTSYLQCTSTAARLGLTACLCAGWGDVGYINRWTFEVSNFSPTPKYLPVGAVIAQLCFEEVATPNKIYGQHQGEYQKGTDLEQIKSNWTPSMMIPHRLKVYP